jgi:ADP-ribose pyrophosphatase
MRLHEDAVELANGASAVYGWVEKPPAAIIVALEDAHTWLVEQYRHPVGARFWELPQGAWDGDHDADPEALARGELAEETGLRAGSMRRLTTLYFAYGISSQRFDVWLATDLTQGEQALEHTEQGLRVGRFPLADVEAMMRDGRIADSATVAAFGVLALAGR